MRISKDMKKIDISGKMADLLAYFRKNKNIIASYLYGSYGTTFQTNFSDVDLALLTQTKTDFNKELTILGEVQDILAEDDISIVFLNDTNLVMQYTIISTGRLIYCDNQDFLTDFIEKTAKLFCDFSIDLKIFYADYDQALKEEFLDGI